MSEVDYKKLSYYRTSVPISKSHLLQLTKALKLREKGLVSVQSIWTEKGARNTNLYKKEYCVKKAEEKR